MNLQTLVLFLSLVVPVLGQFGNIFEHLFRQQQQQQDPRAGIHKDSNWVEHSYDEDRCDKYLCPDTLACVKNAIDCPCPFSGSQLKCVLPDKKAYVCISKPADGDPEKRDCSFVKKAWEGKV
ncbi:long chronological lifespan protein 2 [Trichomonascus vanleenenianus]|uniref:Lcl2p n=1 Tax=Trichomonascus vanleenenianus TaxID=2268995 RepID=UPI003EC9B61A